MLLAQKHTRFIRQLNLVDIKDKLTTTDNSLSGQEPSTDQTAPRRVCWTSQPQHRLDTWNELQSCDRVWVLSATLYGLHWVLYKRLRLQPDCLRISSVYHKCWALTVVLGSLRYLWLLVVLVNRYFLYIWTWCPTVVEQSINFIFIQFHKTEPVLQGTLSILSMEPSK